MRAMETAGKLVENDELRDALKENGIGRPSTRAAIIETLFKRHYIRKERKNLYPTATGVEMIATIHDELLKSAELTGLWEKKLRQIERGTYEARTFLDELKQLVHQVVYNVLSDQSGRAITIEQPAAEPTKQVRKTRSKSPSETATTSSTKPKRTKKAEAAASPASNDAVPRCPLCGQGTLLRGKSAYGCSAYKNGCTFRLDYATYGPDLTDQQLIELVGKWAKQA